MNELYWYASRATGLAATVLLTGVFVLGLVSSARHRPHGPSQTVVAATHRSLALGTSAFLLVHVASAVIDGYVPLTWLDAVVPFVSGYERAATGLGTLAVDLLVAVVVTSLLRHRLPERAWRAVHLTAYLLWPVAIVHSIALGTADQPLLRGTSIACAAVGLGAAAWRAVTVTPDERARTAVAAKEWA